MLYLLYIIGKEWRKSKERKRRNGERIVKIFLTGSVKVPASVADVGFDKEKKPDDGRKSWTRAGDREQVTKVNFPKTAKGKKHRKRAENWRKNKKQNAEHEKPTEHIVNMLQKKKKMAQIIGYIHLTSVLRNGILPLENRIGIQVSERMLRWKGKRV